MTTRLFLAIFSFLIASQAVAKNSPITVKALAPVKGTRTETAQDAKLKDLLGLSRGEFEERLFSDVNGLLTSYRFSTISIQERDAQIRDYLRLANVAIQIDDQNVSIEFVYDTYSNNRLDFDRVMKEIVANKSGKEVLTPAAIEEIRFQLKGMEKTYRQGNGG